MDEWRRSSSNWEQGSSRQPKYGRPPPYPSGPTYQTVPSWEKKYCSSVGISWKKLCETKDVMHMYKNVVDWDDSGALEDLHNSKARFWAALNGLPCNIPLPDPDIYNDKVNYYPVIDPELVADLDKKEAAPVDGDNDANNGWDSFSSANKPIIPTGWGDEEDPIPSNGNAAERHSVNWDTYIDKPIVATGWDDAEYADLTNNTTDVPHSSSWDIKGDFNNAWNSGSRHIDGDYSNGNAWNHSSGWGDGGNVQNNSWGSGGDNSWDNVRNNSRGPWENRKYDRDGRNGRKREGGGQFGLRSTRSKYQVDSCQTNNRWSNSRGRNRTNYSSERTTYAKQPIAMW